MYFFNIKKIFLDTFAPGTMQIAQVLGVRAPNMPPSQYGTPPATPVSGSILIPTQQTNFAQPQLQQHQQRITTLGVPTSGTTRLPLDLYCNFKIKFFNLNFAGIKQYIYF